MDEGSCFVLELGVCCGACTRIQGEFVGERYLRIGQQHAPVDMLAHRRVRIVTVKGRVQPLVGWILGAVDVNDY